MKLTLPAIGAALVLIATIAGVYYTGHSAGRNSVNLQRLEQENADLIRFTKSQQEIYERYDIMLQDIHQEAPGKTPVPPVIARVIERLPDPAKDK
jgi:hypothetical protein